MVELAFKIRSQVGEGPIWDEKTRELLWIDVVQGLIHQFNPNTDSNQTIGIGMHIGAIALYSDDHLVAAIRDGFALVNRSDGKIEYINRVLDSPEIRFNDGKCDPRGRFIAGTMLYQPVPGSASLYSCDSKGQVREILSGVGLSNGLAWSKSGDQLFYIDTLSRSIQLFDYDLSNGTLSNSRVHHKFQEDGSPDGMTIDEEGNLWVAMWGGWCLLGIDRAGKTQHRIAMPISQPSSITFGGDNFSKAFITSASYKLSQSQLVEEPLAGSLFVADLGVCGAKPYSFLY